MWQLKFSNTSDFNENWYLPVFRGTDFESEVRFSKLFGIWHPLEQICDFSEFCSKAYRIPNNFENLTSNSESAAQKTGKYQFSLKSEKFENLSFHTKLRFFKGYSGTVIGTLIQLQPCGCICLGSPHRLYLWPILHSNKIKISLHPIVQSTHRRFHTNSAKSGNRSRRFRSFFAWW